MRKRPDVLDAILGYQRAALVRRAHSYKKKRIRYICDTGNKITLKPTGWFRYIIVRPDSWDLIEFGKSIAKGRLGDKQ